MASTAVSWALTLSLVGVGVYYYKPDLLKSLAPPAQSTASTSNQDTIPKATSNKKTKSKKTQASSAVTSGSETVSSDAQSSKKRKIATPAAGAETQAKQQTGAAYQDDSGIGDQEFAQQLAKAQTGTNLQKAADQNTKSKKKKSAEQQAASSAQASELSAETSSTAGRDADDDLTPADSPAVGAVDGPSKSGDISDMLEAPGAKPTTLRLTGVPDATKNKKKAAAQPFEQVLSKKQRQAQAKKEELRQMKEESDRVHEAKKQEQLRRARTAAGTSNQTKADNFARSANAWQSDKGNAAVKAAPSASPAPLLDTFEPQANNVSQPNGAVHAESIPRSDANTAGSLKQTLGEGRASAATASSREAQSSASGTWAGQITEEDQMQLLKDQQAEDAWESVTSKKSKKKTRQDVDSGSEAPSGGYTAPAAPAPVANATGVNNKPGRNEASTTNRFNTIQIASSSGLADAEWEA